MFLLAKYGVQTTFTFPIVKRGLVDLAATGDWTPATGDTKISKDGGNVANTTNNPSAIGGTGSIMWTLTLTATELQAAVVDIQIVDSATKVVEDQVLKVYTYGNASAKIIPDLSVANLAANVTQWLGSTPSGLSSGNVPADALLLGGSGDAITNLLTEFGQQAGSARHVLVATTVASVTSQTVMVLTAGSADNNAYVGAIAVFKNGSLATGMQRSFRRITAYVGASKTITLDSAPDFTVATNDLVAILVPQSPTVNQNADALLDRTAGVETGLTVRQALRLLAAAMFGKASGLAGTTATFRDTGDTKDRIVATVDANGNRTAVTTDPS